MLGKYQSAGTRRAFSSIAIGTASPPTRPPPLDGQAVRALLEADARSNERQR
jgi:hypothetical protein